MANLSVGNVLNRGDVALASVILLLVWLAGTTIYRLFLHPLAKFPGPRLAALTTWYEGYYDVVQKGRFTFQLEALHEAYGSIIRIGPNELHILDSSYYNTLYSNRHRLDKYAWFYGMLGNPEATFPTIDAGVHKQRRGALAPFFSTQSVLRFSARVQSHTDAFCARMRRCKESGEPVPLFFAFRCLTVDIIAEYMFGHDLNMLARPDWGREFYSAWRALWEMSPLIRQLPFILSMFNAMPRWALALVQPKALEVIDMQLATNKLTQEVLASDPERLKTRAQPTVLWEVAHSDALPPEEKSLKRISLEANNILAAGFETTGGTLTHLIYLVLAHPDVHAKLLMELEDAIPNPDKMPDYQTLEKLPYLWAVVKETLRLSVGAYSRLPRVNKHSSMQYASWTIPAGTAIGMSALYIAHDATIFPSPRSFQPARWLAPGARDRLEPFLTAFGKGTRRCVGENLAYAELYVVAASVLRRFPTLKLWETGPEDVEAVHDYFAGMWRFEDGRKGLQVVIGE